MKKFYDVTPLWGIRAIFGYGQTISRNPGKTQNAIKDPAIVVTSGAAVKTASVDTGFAASAVDEIITISISQPSRFSCDGSGIGCGEERGNDKLTLGRSADGDLFHQFNQGSLALVSRA